MMVKSRLRHINQAIQKARRRETVRTPWWKQAAYPITNVGRPVKSPIPPSKSKQKE